MAYECVRDDGELLATFGGPLLIEELLGAMEEFGTLDPELTTTHSILDFTGVTEVDLGLDEMHQFATRVRMLFPRSRVHRFAVVAPTPVTQKLIRDYIEVRNVLAVRPPEGPNEVAMFDTVDPARAWASRREGEADAS